LISTDSVIYRLEEVLEDVMKSHMPVERVSSLEGTANVLQMFSYKISPSKSRRVAGLDVVSGAMRETATHFFRVMRGEDEVLPESSGAQLKRFKDTVHEVKSGFECGLSLDNFEDIQVGDRIECYKFEKVQKELIVHSNKKVTYAPVKKSVVDKEEEEEEED
jgi:translation initiation factor IF-2